MKMGGKASAAGRMANEVVSFLVFSVLDLLDAVLCLVYKLVDYAVESEWRPCYCSATKDMITGSGKILVSENGGVSKVVCLSSRKLHLEDISDTLYARASLVSDVSRWTVAALRRLGTLRRHRRTAASSSTTATTTTTFTINSTIVEMLKGKIGGQNLRPTPRWSDCECKTCNSWISDAGHRNSLYVHVEGPRDGGTTEEDVIFIHGFISSSSFWTETVFPNFTEAARARYRLFAVDLLGFGRSPKPGDSLYTLREHVEMIEKSVIEQYKVRSFHIVAHSLGSILGLALAAKYPDAVKSLTLLAPPYFPTPKGEQGTQYVMRRVAPRQVWPLISFGASLVCWYEHIGRTICLVLCKYHLTWEFAFKLITMNRMKTFLMEGFFGHTHNASWHTLHNIICGSAGRIERYLDAVRDRLRCPVTVFHGKDDELIPVDCSYSVQSRVPRARVELRDRADHLTLVVGRPKAFARELEDIWDSSS